MNHQTDTPASFSNVPGHTRLFRRNPGGTYYLRAKVPALLRPIIGKTEFRISLRTKEYKVGVARVKLESIKVDHWLAEAESKLTGQLAQSHYSKEELFGIVSGWFVEQEAKADRFRVEVYPHLGEDEKETVVDSMKADDGALHPGEGRDSGEDDLDAFLAGKGRHLGIKKGSKDYIDLCEFFRSAKTETLSRSISRLQETRRHVPDPRFYGLHSAITPPGELRAKVPLGKFLDGFMAYQKKAHSQATVDAYALCVQLLRDILGNSRSIESDVTPRNRAKECVGLGITSRYSALYAAFRC